ncbi:MAG TPA: ATP-binding protein [Bryobacteraceae bacterium]|nr:ATP-binding protein [Bryobacteraceae bacterium]
MPRLAGRLALSVGLLAAGIVVGLCLRGIDVAAAALLLVLVSLGVAKIWGRTAAFSAAIAVTVLFAFCILPAQGHESSNAEQGISLAAFLLTVVTIGPMAAHSERRHDEIAMLYRLENVLLEAGTCESGVTGLADSLARIFAADAVALYDKYSGAIVRSGLGAAELSDETLRAAGDSGSRHGKASPPFLLALVRHGDEVVGALAMSGSLLSTTLLEEVAGRVGLGLTQRYAMEKTTGAEVRRRAEELKAAVLDAMAHEIRNPLNSIKIAATTLLSGSEMYRQEMLTIISEEVDRMDLFIEETVQLARAKADELALHKEPQEMAQLIPAAIAEMRVLAGSRRLQVCIPEPLPPAECDKVLIARVLRQLLSNAIKYSPDGSPLTVSATYNGADIVIDVIDRGPGVAAGEQDRIFEKYYRGRAAGATTRGTGLGLASARSIMQAHGGDIWVTSPAGGGAAFHLSLPMTGNGDCAPGRS